MRISIITVNLNNKTGITQTIASVINQTYPNIEYIIIDGGSIDGSVEVIKEHEDRITYWVSEPDRGIYHAMNKGVKRATGDYLLMLNSGDYLIDENIIERFVKLNPTEAIVYGNLKWQKDKNLNNHKFPKELSFKYFINNALGHQSMFIHNTVHKIIGYYDEEFRITADWKLTLLSYSKYNLPFKYIDFEISVCQRDGISFIPTNWNQILKERRNLLEKEFSTFIQDYEHLFKLEAKLNIIESSTFYKIKSKINKYFFE